MFSAGVQGLNRGDAEGGAYGSSFDSVTPRCILRVHFRAIGARSNRVSVGCLLFPIAALPTRPSKSAITEGPLTSFPAERNDHGDMTQDSDKPKPQASKGPDVQKAAREYLRMLRTLNPAYDVKAAKSVVVINWRN